MTMNDKTYDVLKWIAMIVLPAVATLYFTLASIWGSPIWRTDCWNNYCGRHIPWCITRY